MAFISHWTGELFIITRQNLQTQMFFLDEKTHRSWIWKRCKKNRSVPITHKAKTFSLRNTYIQNLVFERLRKNLIKTSRIATFCSCILSLGIGNGGIFARTKTFPRIHTTDHTLLRNECFLEYLYHRRFVYGAHIGVYTILF